MDEREQLEQAIAAQESLRGVVGDSVVDATVSALQKRLAELDSAGREERRRKQITLLFADVSGFTPMSEAMDAEDLADTLNELWERLDAAITTCNGRIDKHIGDAVMGVWGVHEAREDDPEQAIRAALAMQAAIGEFAAEARGAALSIRIGINTGLVMLGEVGTTSEFTAMGDAVNVASRLEKAAPVGGVLISHDTYRHVKGIFSVEEQPPLEVKGKRGTLRTYIVHGVRPRAFRLETRGVEGIETRMIGRDDELEHLKTTLSQSAREKTFRLVEVIADAGIGKSRLLYEFEDWLRVQPMELLLFKGRADRQHQGVPYYLLRDLVFFRFEIADEDPPPEAIEKLERGIGSYLGDAGQQAAHLIGHLIGLDMAGSPIVEGIRDDARQLRDRALNWISRLLRAMALEAPLAILLEDLHWADHGSLDSVTHIAETCTGSPITVVAMMRPSLFDRIPDWAEDLAGLSRLVLEPLSEEESGRLVEEVLQRVPDVPDEMYAKIVASAAGVPFYLEEIVKMMIEDGVIDAGKDVWELKPGRVRELQVPPTLTGVLQARLDRLPPDERDTLQRASVVGRIFWDGAIPPPAATDREPDDGNLLGALQDKELVYPQDRADFAGTTEYMFKHAILHEVTYETVLKGLRRVYHRHVAEWLASREESAAHAAMIARQYGLADDPAAAPWYGRAAESAQAKYANEEAVTYYRLALESTVLDPPEQIRLLQGLGEVLMLQAEFDEALAANSAMISKAEATGDAAAQARGLTAMAATQVRRGANREALACAEQAEQLLRTTPSPDPVDLANALSEAGWDLLRLGRMAEARAKGEEALLLAETAGHRKGVSQIQALLGAVHLVTGNYELAAAHMAKPVEIDRERGDRIGEGRGLNNLGEIARLQGDFAKARSYYQEALAIQSELGDRDQEALSLSNLGAVACGMGEHSEAIGFLQKAADAFEAAGGSEHLSETYRFLAEAYLGLKHVDKAREAALRALVHGREDENPDHVGNAWRLLALVGAATGEPVTVEEDGEIGSFDAGSCFGRSVAVLAAAGMERDRALTLWDWARVELGEGSAARGEQMWQEARDILTDLGLELFLKRMDAERPDLAGSTV